MTLYATRTITYGEPIRAPYGWLYWYQPSAYDKGLMQKAFDGYLNDIARDEDTATAWAFALHVDRTVQLSHIWNQLHIQIPAPHSTTDNISSQTSDSSAYSNYSPHAPLTATTHVRIKHSCTDTPLAITHSLFHAQRTASSSTGPQPTPPPHIAPTLPIDDNPSPSKRQRPPLPDPKEDLDTDPHPANTRLPRYKPTRPERKRTDHPTPAPATHPPPPRLPNRPSLPNPKLPLPQPTRNPQTSRKRLLPQSPSPYFEYTYIPATLPPPHEGPKPSLALTLLHAPADQTRSGNRRTHQHARDTRPRSDTEEMDTTPATTRSNSDTDSACTPMAFMPLRDR